MNLKIREAIANDYLDIKNLVLEVHNLQLKIDRMFIRKLIILC